MTTAAVMLAACDRPPPRQPRTVADARPRVSGTRITYPAGLQPWLTLANERVRVASMLNVPRRLRYGDFVWDDAGLPAGPVRIRIDLARQTMSVFRGGNEIGAAVILYGTDGKPTPVGVFPVLARAKHHVSTLYDAEMPYMLRLTNDGVAIHASDVREGRATHGCIGIPIDFARRLFDQVRRGDRVEILPA